MTKKYTFWLLSNDSGEVLELQDAPEGWESTRFNLIRDLAYLGVLKSLSVDFDFVGDGFFFLQKQRLLYSMDADITLRIYKTTPNEFLFEGKVNFESYEEDRRNNRFKVDIVQSSFVQKFQNREDVEVNVLNTVSLDRLPVPSAQLRPALIRGRQIEFYSEFDGVIDNAGTPWQWHHTIPFKLKVNGNPGVQEVIATQTDWNSNSDITQNEPPVPPVEFAKRDAAFYINDLPQDQVINLTWAFTMKAIYSGIGPPWYLNEGPIDLDHFPQWRLIMRVFNSDNEVVSTVFTDFRQMAYGIFNLSGSHVITVPGDGGYVVFSNEQTLLSTGSGGPTFISGTLQMFGFMDDQLKQTYEYSNMSMTINQSSSVDNSTHDVILPHELFTNLIGQINGGKLYSPVFGRAGLIYDYDKNNNPLSYTEDGEHAYLAITKGEFLRGVTNGQVTMSLRSAFKSYSSICCLGAKLLNDNTLVIDKLDTLFSGEQIIEGDGLGEVNRLRIGPAKEFLFNSVKAGYPVQEYEQENGRDEFNTTYQFTNTFKSIKKELDLTSIFCGDGYGIEFARRAAVISTGTQDTKYDEKIFFIDLINNEGELISRRLEGILHVEGIFSPETAINLRIAVGQNMLRWSKYLNIPLHKKPKTYHFQSKDKNASLNLVTALGTTIDGQDISTSGPSLFISEDRKFEFPIDVLTLYAIIANPFGVMPYSYEGERFLDFIFEVNAENERGKSEWRMLGTRDTPVAVAPNDEDAAYMLWEDDQTARMKFGNGIDDNYLWQ